MMEIISKKSTTYKKEQKDDTVSSGEKQVFIEIPTNKSDFEEFEVVIKEEETIRNTVQCKEILKQEPIILNYITKLPRKKMSYEKDFQPSKPPSKGFINKFKRRKLIVDQHIAIGGKQMKRQINNTHDIITNQDLAPSTKKNMYRLMNGITKMFAYPCHKFPNSLLQLYVANCTSKEQPNAENVIDMKLLPVDYKSGVRTMKTIPKKKGPFITYQKRIEIFSDHKYSKTAKERDTSTPEKETVTLFTDIKIEEELQVYDIKHEEIDLENNDDDRKIVIIHKLGENISIYEKQLEAILANRNSDQVIFCNSTDFEDNGFTEVQNVEIEETIVGTESEYILSN